MQNPVPTQKLAALYVNLGEEADEHALTIMRALLRHEGWKAENLDVPAASEDWPEVWREKDLTSMLSGDDHVGPIQQFFVESLDQIAKELAASKKERPDLPWNGE